MELMLPVHIPPTEVEWTQVDFGELWPNTFGGAPKGIDRGTRWAAVFRWQNLSGADRAYLLGLRAQLRKGNYVWCWDPANKKLGSFPSSELFANNTFESGVSSWGLQNASMSVSGRRARISGVAGIGTAPAIYQSPNLTQYAPHALRSLIVDGAGTAGLTFGRSANLGVGGASASDYSTSRGLGTVSFVALAAAAGSQYPFVNASSSGFVLGGTYADVPYASLTRCALVDGGGNYMLQSDAAATSWTATGVTVSTNAHTAPDGTATADALIESAGGTFHYIQQTYTRAAVAEDWCAYVDVARTAGSRNVMLLVSDGVGAASCVFDLGAGTAGAAGAAGGVTNARAFIVSLGNGYYRCFIIGRLQSTTTVRVEIQMISAGNNSYSGDGTSRLSVWHMGVNRSSVPSVPTPTTTTVVAPTTRPGSGMNVKGLPASTTGLLLPGDCVEIAGERKMLTASLDSDAAGLGYLQFEPAMRVAAANNAPVIIGQPLCKMILAEDAAIPTRPGVFSDLSLVLVEA